MRCSGAARPPSHVTLTCRQVCLPSTLVARAMQAWPLVTGTLLRHAARHHGEQTMVSIGVDGTRTEQTLLQTFERCIKLALALDRLTAVGEVVATLAWNTHRHVRALCQLSTGHVR